VGEKRRKAKGDRRKEIGERRREKGEGNGKRDLFQLEDRRAKPRNFLLLLLDHFLVVFQLV
jgi:hypothetical protein